MPPSLGFTEGGHIFKAFTSYKADKLIMLCQNNTWWQISHKFPCPKSVLSQHAENRLNVLSFLKSTYAGICCGLNTFPQGRCESCDLWCRAWDWKPSERFCLRRSEHGCLTTAWIRADKSEGTFPKDKKTLRVNLTGARCNKASACSEHTVGENMLLKWVRRPLLWCILEGSGKKTKNKHLDESWTCGLGRRRGTVLHDLLNLDYLKDVNAFDTLRSGNIFSMVMGSHSN